MGFLQRGPSDLSSRTHAAPAGYQRRFPGGKERDVGRVAEGQAGRGPLDVAREGARPLFSMQPIVILGGGLAGLSAAHFLQHPWILVEKSERVGGLIKTEVLEGCLFD